MNKKTKIIFIISLSLNLILILSIVGIGFKAWHHKNHHGYSYDEGYFEDHHHEGGHHHKGRDRMHHKPGLGLRFKVFSTLKDNENLKANFKEIKEIRKEMLSLAQGDDPIPMEKIEPILARMESLLQDSVVITHEELLKLLEGMSDQERKKTINLFLRR